MLKRSMIVSGMLHVAVIAAAAISWPHALIPSDQAPPVIPVELVTIAEETNIAPTAAEPPQPEPETPPPPAEEPPPPPPVAEVAPVPDKPLPPEPKQAEIPKPAAPKNPALPTRKPRPEPEQRFDVDSVLALLDRRTPRPPPPPPQAKPAETTVRALGNQDARTMDVRDALLSQMRECWNVPVGAPNPERLIVQVRVFLTPDGRLAQAPQLEPTTRQAMASDRYVRTAAEAALRAVNVCEPYKRLPRESYDDWREVVMTFDPSKMIGR